uniref:Uncharacterized protein n=1 Tax=viral metagenome TaxID=1070528 RepID=A0A6M3JJ07_9ZZZZ
MNKTPYSPSPSMSPEENKRYQEEMIRGNNSRRKLNPKEKMIKRLAIIGWCISHPILFFGGLTLAIDYGWIGLIGMIICWIITGVSIWTMVDYGNNGGFNNVS